MHISVLIFMAIGLSMDAFAASVSGGMVLCQVQMKKTVRIAAMFGFFQGLMPLIGYTVASQFAKQVETVDHWVAFVLLSLIGGKMIWDSVKSDDDNTLQGDPSSWGTLFVTSVATSIDALAVGVSIAVMPKTGILSSEYGFLISFLIIAVITFALSMLGVVLGCRFGGKLGKKAAIAGGVILVIIGVKILIEHLFFA